MPFPKGRLGGWDAWLTRTRGAALLRKRSLEVPVLIRGIQVFLARGSHTGGTSALLTWTSGGFAERVGFLEKPSLRAREWGDIFQLGWSGAGLAPYLLHSVTGTHAEGSQRGSIRPRFRPSWMIWGTFFGSFGLGGGKLECKAASKSTCSA